MNRFLFSFYLITSMTHFQQHTCANEISIGSSHVSDGGKNRAVKEMREFTELIQKNDVSELLITPIVACCDPLDTQKNVVYGDSIGSLKPPDILKSLPLYKTFKMATQYATMIEYQLIIKKRDNTAIVARPAMIITSQRLIFRFEWSTPQENCGEQFVDLEATDELYKEIKSLMIPMRK
jgi:hypothetical protein